MHISKDPETLTSAQSEFGKWADTYPPLLISDMTENDYAKYRVLWKWTWQNVAHKIQIIFYITKNTYFIILAF